MADPAIERGLRAGLIELGLDLADAQIGQLLAYLGVLSKWSRVYNLTALKDPGDMLTHHLLDCLAVVAPLVRQMGGGPLAVVDVGSGAGLPGVVIAICCPDIRVDCVDAVEKKAAFVRQVAATLQLANLRGVHARVETLERAYDLACSRAFASLADFVEWSNPALRDEGVWMAMKGKFPGSEIELMPPGVEVFHVEQLKVPGLQAERCLVWMRRAKPVT